MPSESLKFWSNERKVALDEIEHAHVGIGGSAPGRRYATQQLNFAYVLLLCSHFQAFCRDLHSECSGQMVIGIAPPARAEALRFALVHDRKLDRGNANPGNIGSDFNLFGLFIWDALERSDIRNKPRHDLLQELNDWRNAIAHYDFNKIGSDTTLHLRHVRAWRAACNQLAAAFDEVMRRHLEILNGVSPW